jgi:hypothetical protein
MAQTLVEAAKLSNDVLQAGIIELLVYEDPLLERLKWADIQGNGLTYVTEATMPNADFYSVGDTWTESTGTNTQATAQLKILGGDVDVDNFLKRTRSNINDLQAETIEAKVKAVKKAFMDCFYYGYNTGSLKQFDGMHYLINSATYNTIALGSASGTPVLLNMIKLEQGIDMPKGFAPQLIMMSKSMRRYINRYLHGVGGITYGDGANARVQTLYGVPVGFSDYIGNDESCDRQYTTLYGYDYADLYHGATDHGATTIFILNFDSKGCMGLQADPLQVEKVGTGNLETKDATRTRIKWYVSLMMQSLLSCCKITGIDYDGTVAA